MGVLMYTGRMIKIAVWGRNERILAALIAAMVAVAALYIGGMK